jgi:hypothetical protein
MQRLAIPKSHPKRWLKKPIVWTKSQKDNSIQTRSSANPGLAEKQQPCADNDSVRHKILRLQ